MGCVSGSAQHGSRVKGLVSRFWGKGFRVGALLVLVQDWGHYSGFELAVGVGVGGSVELVEGSRAGEQGRRAGAQSGLVLRVLFPCVLIS